MAHHSQPRRDSADASGLVGLLRICLPHGRSPTGIVCGGIIGLWLLAASRWLLADAVVPWDSKNQFYAFFRFVADALHSGATPFWNPYHYGGHPTVADPQSLIFAPLFLLWALIDPSPSMQAFDLLVYGHLLIGGLCIGIMGLRAGWPAAACLLAGSIFMFGGAASGRLTHTGVIITYGLFPPALLLMQLAFERRSCAIGLGFALVASAMALGRNQVALLFCYVLIAAAVAQIVAARGRWRYLRERAPMLGVMSMAGVCLTALPTLLTIQFAALSNRPASVLEQAFESSLHPANLATLVAANILGSHQFPPWGPNYLTEPLVASVDEAFNYMFVGWVPMILLLWFGLIGGRIFQRGQVMLAGILGLSVLYMLGRYTPIFGWAFAWVPGVDLFRRPVDANFVFGAALSLLAGRLLADYVRSGAPAAKPVRSLVATLAVLGVLAWAVMFSHRSGRAETAMIELLKIAPIPVLVILLLSAARDTTERTRAAIAVTCIAMAELIWWNGSSRMNAEPRAHYAVLEAPQEAEAEALERLEREIRARQANGERPRVEIVGIGGPWQNLAIVRRLEATNGYNPLRIGFYDRLISPGETTYLMAQRKFPRSFDGYGCPLARALGLEYVVLGMPIDNRLAGAAVKTVLHSGPRLWIYRLKPTLPRLAFNTRAVVADASGTDALGLPLATPSAGLVLIDDDTPPKRSYASVAAAQSANAHITAWRPDRIEIEAVSVSGGVLALHDVYYPGWVAEVDGKAAPIMRADLLFRAVEVPAGRRRIVFRYAPFAPQNLLDAVNVALRRSSPLP
jgi:hypothetical protein